MFITESMKKGGKFVVSVGFFLNFIFLKENSTDVFDFSLLARLEQQQMHTLLYPLLPPPLSAACTSHLLSVYACAYIYIYTYLHTCTSHDGISSGFCFCFVHAARATRNPGSYIRPPPIDEAVITRTGWEAICQASQKHSRRKNRLSCSLCLPLEFMYIHVLFFFRYFFLVCFGNHLTTCARPPGPGVILIHTDRAVSPIHRGKG